MSSDWITKTAFMAFPCTGGFAGGLIFTRKGFDWYNVRHENLRSKIIFQLPRLSVHTSVRPYVRPSVRTSVRNL